MLKHLFLWQCLDGVYEQAPHTTKPIIHYNISAHQTIAAAAAVYLAQFPVHLPGVFVGDQSHGHIRP